MDDWSAPAPVAAPQRPQQLQADLQQQVASNANPRLELALGPQEMPVRACPAPAPGEAVQPARVGWRFDVALHPCPPPGSMSTLCP